jgi:hypothetical protein
MQAVSAKNTYHSALTAPDRDGTSDLPCVILEDDVWLIGDFPTKVTSLIGISD